MNTNELLRTTRMALGLTLETAAKRVGIRPMSVWRHEQGLRRLSLEIAAKYAEAYGLTLNDLAMMPCGRTSSAPSLPVWITHDPRVGITCHACSTVAEGITLDSPEGRQFVADHAGHEDPYPAMRKGQPAEAEVGA